MVAALKQHFDSRAFLIGIMAFALLYVLLFSYAIITSSKTITAMESQLASQAVLIKKPQVLVDESPSRDIEPKASKEKLDIKSNSLSSIALSSAPIEGLYESSPQGLLPKISSDGTTPFNAYKKPFTLPGKPSIAIAVLDYGLSDIHSERMVKDLPAEVSLLLSPYAHDADKWQKYSRQNGHELWILAPANAKNFPATDPGTEAILSNAGLKYNKDRLSWVLSRTTGYTGIAMSTNSQFTNSPLVLETILEATKERGLGYFEVNPNVEHKSSYFPESGQLPYVHNTVFTDRTSFKSIENMARQNGFVVAVAPPYPKSIQSLRVWAQTLSAKGFALAPLSAITQINPTGNLSSE